MSKRANGEGSISKYKNGLYCARVVMPDGKRKAFYGRTRAEVAKKLGDALQAVQAGKPVPSDRLTVEGYLADWLVAVEPTLKPRTFGRYRTLLTLHAMPFIGRTRLVRLTPGDLRTLYAERQAAGLSPTTIRQLHAILHHALKQAMRDGVVARNVADLVSAPRAAEHEMQTLSPEQARAFLAAASGERLEALYVLALSTGMRQGELLALRWKDVDLEAGALQVQATLQRTKDGFRFDSPKTAGSRRRISLTATASEALRRHRAAQNAARLRLGPAWEDNGLVFANEVGRPIEAGNLLRRSFWPLLEKAELPRIRFHDLRHTAATLMLAKGVHPKIVSEMLGHAKIGITLDLYSHVTMTMQQAAVEALDAVLQG
jgi:integrase